MRKKSVRTNPSRPPFPKAAPPVPPAVPVEVSGPLKLLSKAEVLAILGVSTVTLWDWVRKGHFPPGRVLGTGGGHRSRLVWVKTEVEAAVLNSPRRLPKGSKAVE
jgi:predicted DNA-binding transcriptional regulator AlpA